MRANTAATRGAALRDRDVLNAGERIESSAAAASYRTPFATIANRVESVTAASAFVTPVGEHD